MVDTGLTKEMEREIQNRNREELEEFELDSVRMVGTMQDENNEWGIVLAPGPSLSQYDPLMLNKPPGIVEHLDLRRYGYSIFDFYPIAFV